jgi:signal transduction histidine kinase
MQKYYGLRPGEALLCVNALSSPSGCGTSERCRNCGFVLSVVEALENLKGDGECSIINNEYKSIELSVKSHLIDIGPKKFIMSVMHDISAMKKLEVLQKTMLHDLLNVSAAISGYSKLLFDDISMKDQIIPRLVKLSDQLVSEIKTHKALLLAENGQLVLDPKEIKLNQLIQGLVDAYHDSEFAKDKSIKVEVAHHLKIVTDSSLLEKILLNLIKNACEAIAAKQEVLISANLYDQQHVIISVKNGSFIPIENQGMIFKRSFSTKGGGRGIGTYSIKLFSEKYLQGEVSFISSESLGTTFFLKLPVKINQ